MSNLTFRTGQQASGRMTPRFQIILVLCLAAAIGYAIYGNVTQTGLVGYIMKAEMDLFGSAEEGMTFVVSFITATFALVLLAAVAGKIVPSLVYVSKDSAYPPQPGILERANRPLESISWRAVLLSGAAPILIGGAVAAVLYYTDLQDEKQKVYPIDLSAGMADPPKGAKFVEVTGLMARSYVIVYKRTETGSVSRELFAPIIEKGWTPSEPVRYFVRHQARESYEGKVDWPEAFRHSAATLFSGTISQALPVFAEKEFRSKGLKVSPTYFVISWMDLPNHEVPASGNEGALIALGIGGFISVIVFPMMIVLKIQKARMQRKAAHA